MEPIIDASHVYIRYLLGDFRDIGLKEWTIQKVKRERRVESRWSVEDVSFTLEKGDFLGIIGANGAGKSTIANLIMRLWDVQKGTVCIGGIDVRDLTTDALLGHISTVFQKVYLFNDTIENNIRFGNPHATHEEIIEAAR